MEWVSGDERGEKSTLFCREVSVLGDRQKGL